MKKSILQIISLIFISFQLFSKAGNDTQIIKSGHWIYDSMYFLASEEKQSFFIDNQPMSVGELKFYFNDFVYEDLSENGKEEYSKIKNFLYDVKDFFEEQDGRFYSNLKINPEFYYKTNDDIDWSFNYYLNDYLINLPIIIGFSNYVTMESDFFIGINYPYIHSEMKFHNLPVSGNAFEFLFPKFSYGSFGKNFDNWGYNLHIAKEGLTIGNTKLGSIIYNNTFETDCYIQMNLYNRAFKYNLDVAQVDNKKFLYLHQFNIRPVKNLKFGVVEGSLLNSSFELRYLNPFMIMHSMGSWLQYKHLMDETEYDAYDEGHFCAYLCFTFEYMPFNNFRLYGYYSQNEILDLGGGRSVRALSMPDSIGFQLGGEYNLKLKNGYLKSNLESIYTSPYLYVKQSPEWSLYRTRQDMQHGGMVSNWIGSPFGPDCFAISLSEKYYHGEKWELEFNYLFKIHGENNDKFLFNEENYVNIGTEENPIYIWIYYPYVKWWLANKNKDEKNEIAAKDLARYMWMHGVNEYTNQFSIYGKYKFNQNFSIFGKAVYSLIYNNQNMENSFAQGVELSLAVEYKLFN